MNFWLQHDVYDNLIKKWHQAGEMGEGREERQMDEEEEWKLTGIGGVGVTLMFMSACNHLGACWYPIRQIPTFIENAIQGKSDIDH